MLKILPQIALGLFGITPGNYSGITHVRDNVYAVVDDKDKVDGFKFLTLDIDTVTGKVTNASMEEPSFMAYRRADGQNTDRDCEGIAYFNEANTIFVSGESDQRILEYSLEGKPTGRELDIPLSMRSNKIRFNLGFEALTYNNNQKTFWTTTESTLLADGPISSPTNNTTKNHLRIVGFNTTLSPTQSYVYEMDLPLATNKTATHIHGVPSLLALDDGRLIVMEREGCFPKHEYGSWVRIKLYIVDPKTSEKVSLDTPMEGVKEHQFMKKELLCDFVTRLRIGKMNLSNYEGMCIGPRLSGGRQTIILISDSQNGLGNWLYHIKDHVRLVVLPD